MINGGKLICIEGCNAEAYAHFLSKELGQRHIHSIEVPKKGSSSLSERALNTYYAANVGMAIDPELDIFLALQQGVYNERILPTLKGKTNVVSYLCTIPPGLYALFNPQKLQDYFTRLKDAREYYITDLTFILEHEEESNLRPFRDLAEMVRMNNLSHEVVLVEGHRREEEILRRALNKLQR